MSDEQAARAVVAWSGVGRRRVYLSSPAELRSAWSQFPMPTFRCDLHPDADLDLDLIVCAMETLSGATDVDLTPTSVRIPAPLRELAHAVVDHHWVSSISDLLVTGLRDQLGALTADAICIGDIEGIREALEQHYTGRENERAGLVELTIAAAEIEGHPAADHPDLVTRGVEDLGEDAYIEDVLAWVKGALATVGNTTHS